MSTPQNGAHGAEHEGGPAGKSRAEMCILRTIITQSSYPGNAWPGRDLHIQQKIGHIRITPAMHRQASTEPTAGEVLLAKSLW